MPFRIRQSEKGDFETLWRIDQACFDAQLAYSRPELAFYMRRASAFTLVAADEETRGPGNGAPATRGESLRETNPGSARSVVPKVSGSKVVAAKIKGFIVAEKVRQTGHIITIDVVEEARRLGVGSALLAAAEDRLRESGAVTVELETAVNNGPAIRFYKRQGYFVERTVRGYYSNQLDALVMGKALAS